MIGGTLQSWDFQHVKPDGTNFVAAAGVTVITSDAIDTEGCDEIAIIGSLGVITATGIVAFKLTGCQTVGGTYVDLAGSALANELAATDSSSKFAWDAFRSSFRFIKVVITRTIANSIIEDITAIKLQTKKKPLAESIAAGVGFVVAQSGPKFVDYMIAGTP